MRHGLLLERRKAVLLWNVCVRLKGSGQKQLDREFLDQMYVVMQAIRKAGYSPYEQLVGYLTTGELANITRADGARELVSQMDRDEIRKYLNIRA